MNLPSQCPMESRAARSLANLRLGVALCTIALSLMGCMRAYKQSVGGEGESSLSRLYRASFDETWQAVVESLKAQRIDTLNREAGYLQTRWSENTNAKNFIESFGPHDSVMKAQYRFKVSATRAFEQGEPYVRVAVTKEQVVLRDPLEEWRPIDSDRIEERTLLYRIGQIIQLKKRLARSEQERIDRAIEGSEFAP